MLPLKWREPLTLTRIESNIRLQKTQLKWRPDLQWHWRSTTQPRRSGHDNGRRSSGATKQRRYERIVGETHLSWQDNYRQGTQQNDDKNDPCQSLGFSHRAVDGGYGGPTASFSPFQEEATTQHILQEGPWSVMGSLLSLQLWAPQMTIFEVRFMGYL